jgi:hypothetical protein
VGGGCRHPPPLSDPDVRVSRIRFFMWQVRLQTQDRTDPSDVARAGSGAARRETQPTG